MPWSRSWRRPSELFALNLIRLRKDAGLSQKALSEKAGLTHNFVNDLENRKKGASYKTIAKLTEALNTEPVQFFINPKQWNQVEKQNHLIILNRINDNINRIFDDYRKMDLNTD